ncbi:Octopamine-Tyramine receptor-like protein [Sarcoptes scabiei]|uniref:Octopamine-Tyramine receptor-like protein n=1 Tax=Sarcoptes scabiei TaxID=52283 RepID=A0A132AJ73_SARSC|nr:Octopamine-Tyramine receptor-like protein [Sarcoptes scabiei]
MAMAIIQNNNGGVNDDYLSDLSGDADSGDDGADQSAYYQTLLITIIFGMIMVFTIVGNIMVIYAIFNYRPLHNVQNMFMVSLAVADIAVAVLVMPFNLAYNLLDRWIFGLHLCEMWLTSDV